MVKKVALLYGGNIGETLLVFKKATSILKKKLGFVYAQSSTFKSCAWGFDSENDFLNRLVIFKTDLKASEVLQICLDTEMKLGRERNEMNGYSDRVIDIDILYMEGLVLNSKQLILPHPRIQDRLFALVPLCEVIPEFIHPVLQKSNKSLLSLCTDKTKIEKLE
jgi:2-amino-4-hydroxy-6-hydroxymethyldihydropteridine diphosphokinase